MKPATWSQDEKGQWTCHIPPMTDADVEEMRRVMKGNEWIVIPNGLKCAEPPARLTNANANQWPIIWDIE